MVDESWTRNDHPYNAYSTKHGWAFVVGIEDDILKSRCLVNGKEYVKIYFSQDDEESRFCMERWLEKNEYKRISNWEGKYLAFSDGNSWCPYLDGGLQTVIKTGPGAAKISWVDDGEIESYYVYCNTSGEADIIEHEGQYCIDGEWVDEDYTAIIETTGERVHISDAVFVNYSVGNYNYFGYYYNDDCTCLHRNNEHVFILDEHVVSTYSDDLPRAIFDDKIHLIDKGEGEDEYDLLDNLVLTHDGFYILKSNSFINDEGEILLREEE
jgi:hypothetical protein